MEDRATDDEVCGFCGAPRYVVDGVPACEEHTTDAGAIACERWELRSRWYARSGGPASLPTYVAVRDVITESGGPVGYLPGEAPDPVRVFA